jgi:uncharacterized protein YkwD
VLAPVPTANTNAGTNNGNGNTRTKTPTAPVAPNAGSGGGGIVSVSSSDPIAQAVFSSLNSSRAQAGLPALRWNSALQRSAHQHNLAMASANQMSHQLPGEASFGSRESAQGVSWSSAAENIGWTSAMSTGGALGLEADMMAEPPNQANHRGNILSTSSNSVGIDILLDSTNHKLWLTQDFAHV